MDNSSKFITSKYAVIFEGKNYEGDTKTYSVKLAIDFVDFLPIWNVCSYEAIPLFYNNDVAENFIHTLKTSTKKYITKFLNTWRVDIDSLRVLELGYNNELDFEKVLLNV